MLRLEKGEGRLGLLYSDTWRLEYVGAAAKSWKGFLSLQRVPRNDKTVSTCLATVAKTQSVALTRVILT